MADAAATEPASGKSNSHVEERPGKSVDAAEMPPPTTKTEEDADAETPRMAHDSMVTVRLSEPPSLTLDTSSASDSEPESSPVVGPKTVEHDEHETTKISESSATLETSQIENEQNPRESVVIVRDSRSALPRVDTSRSLQDELGQCEDVTSDTSDDVEEVNWEELEKTEDQQTKDEETDNVGASPLVSPQGCLPQAITNLANPSRRHCFSLDLNRKTQSWLRTPRPLKSKLSRGSWRPKLDRLPWHSCAS